MVRKKKMLKVVFLGGVGEIGKNMTALEYGDNILLIDCGCTFPTMDTPGVDIIVPDFSYIEDNYDKIRGLVITHGHEDHIGGIPFLLSEFKGIPLFGSALSLALVKHKLKERSISIPKLNVVKGGDIKKIGGCFDVEFISVTHSISGAFALSITTPEGVVFHTGDYKIDYTPISDEHIDLSRIAEIGNRGVKLMLGESTNIEKQGSTISEVKVGETLDKIITSNSNKRVIIATFASNVNRIQQIVDICERVGRKVAFNGRSMKNISVMAKELKLLSARDTTIIDIDKIGDIEPHKLCIITTGSQGEPMSALTRMCMGEDKVIVGDQDLIIISSSPIPGNEKAIYNVINNLYRRGAKVVYGSLEALHASGHACQEEIKLMTTLVKPQMFIPVHGEYRHMQQNRDLAVSVGVNPKNTMIAEIGTCIAIEKKGLKRLDNVVAGNTYVDGLSGVDMGILKDRHQLSKDGLLIALISISVEDKEMAALPEIIARGISLDESQIEHIKGIIVQFYEQTNYNIKENRDSFKSNLRKKINRYLNNKLMQKPMVLPIIMEK